jgi:hypothetical protein
VVFISSNAHLGYTTDLCQLAIHVLLGNRSPCSGDIGLEIEVEGNTFPKTSEFEDEEDDSEVIPSQWFYTYDGSLRGHDNAEYVLRKPLLFNEVPLALDDLWHMFKKFGSELDESNRTSVHVHLNVQSWHINRLAAFAGLYFSVEEVLTNWCGDARVGNLFCLRGIDAPAIIGKLRQFLNTGDLSVFDEGLHYSAFNLHAIKKLGSVEIRTMRGCRDPETIKTWVSVLQRLYELSDEYPDPRGVCEGFSGLGWESYVRGILGPNSDQILRDCGMTTDEVRQAMYRGIRLAQNVCYCRDWPKFQASKAKPDPFGRSAKALSYYFPEPVVVGPTATAQGYFIDDDITITPV